MLKPPSNIQIRQTKLRMTSIILFYLLMDIVHLSVLATGHWIKE